MSNLMAAFQDSIGNLGRENKRSTRCPMVWQACFVVQNIGLLRLSSKGRWLRCVLLQLIHTYIENQFSDSRERSLI